MAVRLPPKAVFSLDAIPLGHFSLLTNRVDLFEALLILIPSPPSANICLLPLP